MLQRHSRLFSLIPMGVQQRTFTRSVRKIILTKDTPNLGFTGEICFVKPGFALNHLIPRKAALFWSDPEAQTFTYDESELKKKQQMRSLELFLGKLKDIKLVFEREVSEINKNVAKMPVTTTEVLQQLNKRYNMGIKKEDFKMETGIDTIGEHYVQVTYRSELYQKNFSFYVKVHLRGKAAKEEGDEKGKKKAKAAK